VALEHRERIWW